jgi:hypothetical protein
MPINIHAIEGVADAEDKHIANGAWQLGKTSVRDRIAVADDEERGAAGRPPFCKSDGLAYAVDERSFTRSECILEGQVVEDILHHLNVERVDHGGFCAGIESHDTNPHLIQGHALEH